MSGLVLSCCAKGLEQTRHFTPELGTAIAAMLAAAVVAGGALLVVLTVLRRAS